MRGTRHEAHTSYRADPSRPTAARGWTLAIGAASRRWRPKGRQRDPARIRAGKQRVRFLVDDLRDRRDKRSRGGANRRHTGTAQLAPRPRSVPSNNSPPDAASVAGRLGATTCACRLSTWAPARFRLPKRSRRALRLSPCWPSPCRISACRPFRLVGLRIRRGASRFGRNGLRLDGRTLRRWRLRVRLAGGGFCFSRWLFGGDRYRHRDFGMVLLDRDMPEMLVLTVRSSRLLPQEIRDLLNALVSMNHAGTSQFRRDSRLVRNPLCDKRPRCVKCSAQQEIPSLEGRPRRRLHWADMTPC